MVLKDIIDKTNNKYDLWFEIQKHGGELLFEELVATKLKATLPGETYWLGEEVVPPKIAQQYNFQRILKGMRSIGADIINVHNGRAVAYESKWFNSKETIRFEKVANKLQVINKTGIDQLIFCTNARKQSAQVKEFASEAGFLFQDEWQSGDTYKVVKEYYKNNSYKAKSIILQELRKNNNIKSLSNPVFNKIIENKY